MKIGERLDGLSVLVVDDDADTLDLMKTLLEMQGADVAGAAVAEDAFVQYSSRRPDVLVSDLSMPGRDGLWLISEVRKLGGRRVPAIAVTGQSGHMSLKDALRHGFDVYFTKPVDPCELWAAVAAAGRSSSRSV
jgi:CheY-like chemotaxis protein